MGGAKSKRKVQMEEDPTEDTEEEEDDSHSKRSPVNYVYPSPINFDDFLNEVELPISLYSPRLNDIEVYYQHAQGDCIRPYKPPATDLCLEGIEMEEGIMRFIDVYISCLLLPDKIDFANLYLRPTNSRRHVQVVEKKFEVSIRQAEHKIFHKGRFHNVVLIFGITAQSVAKAMAYMASTIPEMKSAVSDVPMHANRDRSYIHKNQLSYNNVTKLWAASVTKGFSTMIFAFRQSKNLPTVNIDMEQQPEYLYSTQNVAFRRLREADFDETVIFFKKKFGHTLTKFNDLKIHPMMLERMRIWHERMPSQPIVRHPPYRAKSDASETPKSTHSALKPFSIGKSKDSKTTGSTNKKTVSRRTHKSKWNSVTSSGDTVAEVDGDEWMDGEEYAAEETTTTTTTSSKSTELSNPPVAPMNRGPLRQTPPSDFMKTKRRHSQEKMNAHLRLKPTQMVTRPSTFEYTAAGVTGSPQNRVKTAVVLERPYDGKMVETMVKLPRDSNMSNKNSAWSFSNDLQTSSIVKTVSVTGSTPHYMNFVKQAFMNNSNASAAAAAAGRLCEVTPTKSSYDSGIGNRCDEEDEDTMVSYDDELERWRNVETMDTCIEALLAQKLKYHRSRNSKLKSDKLVEILLSQDSHA